ncbi:MAG TPA: hypothetical protein ENK89_03755 [Desulfobulbaceae bacterium]|nr:hypothetical protein [Desulfobulbaceae bacterium]
MTTLRIATLNTWKCDGSYEKRLAVMIDQLQKEQLDILCCQEVFRSMDGRFDTVSTLAAELGMNYSFAAARSKKRIFRGEKIDSYSGMAVLSRPGTPMLFSHTMPLPEVEEDKDRAAQFIVLRSNGNGILVVNLHLSHLKGAENLRREQLCTILSHPILEKNYAAVILCGDFNEGADSTVRYLKNDLKYNIRDGYLAGGGKKNASSMHLKKNKQKPERIDHIFILQEKSNPPAKLSLCNSRMILNRPERGIYASDHRGIALDLEISRIKSNEHTQLFHFLSFAPKMYDMLQNRI